MPRLGTAELWFARKFQACPAWVQKLGVVFVLGLAALCMVLAWIYHLRWDTSFGWAYLLSLAFVLPEFLLNTWITRYAYHARVFGPGQLAMISIITGVIFIGILSVTMFGEKNMFDTSTVLGFLLAAAGAVLLLHNKNF